MKAKLLVPVGRILLLAAIAASMVSCAGSSSNEGYNSQRTVDPFPFHHHRFHNHHCKKL
jgi:hypothetical protein